VLRPGDFLGPDRAGAERDREGDDQPIFHGPGIAKHYIENVLETQGPSLAGWLEAAAIPGTAEDGSRGQV
jgi:hypothetical protein